MNLMNSPDEIVRCLAAGGSVRVVAAVTTGTAREAARRHRATGSAAIALARGATAGLLLATLTKDEERLTLQVLGDGPLGGVTVDARSSGGVRAYLKNPSAKLPVVGRSAAGRAPLGPTVGRNGIVSVIRDLGLRDTFSGQTALVSGEIDTDVEHYLNVSEQIDSALGCEAILAAGGGIDSEMTFSGGVLIQALPGGGTALVEHARQRLRDGALLRALGQGDEPLCAEDLARAVLAGATSDVQVLDARPVRFECQCSRARAIDSLSLLGSAELAAMILEDGKAEVTCNFCRERYDFSESDLETIRRETQKPTGLPS
jgi:molecular chaperone Hsp33